MMSTAWALLTIWLAAATGQPVAGAPSPAAARPIADELLKHVTGDYTADYEAGAAAWSNELVLHVVEFKTNGPAPSLEPLPELFQDQVIEVNRILEQWDARLLPTGMHPFFDPMTETKIWPHEYNAVYETYNRIFDCRGHGWSNLQSTHINLPFADDEEFGRLHAAIRYLLPILPGLAASSPVADGKLAPALDYRLVQYAQNSARIPIATGQVVPEELFAKGHATAVRRLAQAKIHGCTFFGVNAVAHAALQASRLELFVQQGIQQVRVYAFADVPRQFHR